MTQAIRRLCVVAEAAGGAGETGKGKDTQKEWGRQAEWGEQKQTGVIRIRHFTASTERYVHSKRLAKTVSFANKSKSVA